VVLPLLEKEVFELISPMVYYLQVVSRAMPHLLSVALFFESVSAIGFVCRRFELLNGLHDCQISNEDLNYLIV